MRSRGMLIVEESKFPENVGRYLERFEPYESQRLQTLLYLNSRFTEDPSLGSGTWFDIPHREKMWIVNVKDKRTGESVRIFRGVQNVEAEEFLKAKVSRFAMVVLGKLEPEHHRSTGRCRSCGLSDDCEYKVD
jgi:hypothetical protein